MKFSQFLSENEGQFFTTLHDVEEWMIRMISTGNHFTIHGDLTVSVEGDFVVTNGVGGKIPVKFREVSGNFKIFHKSGISSLIGSPHRCAIFDCGSCDNITSLEGAPQLFQKFIASQTNITNFEGLPKDESGDIEISDCFNLVSLAGSPRKIIGGFIITNNGKLKSLEGGPEEINGTFNASACDLRSLKHGPHTVHGSYGVSSNAKLKSLEGIANYVGKNLVISNTPSLKSLKNIHKLVTHCTDFYFSDYYSNMLGVIYIASGIKWDVHHVVNGSNTEKSEKVASILRKYVGTGNKGVIAAQNELLDADLDEVAEL